MSTYIFRSEGAAVEISLSRAESILYVWMCESPPWEVPVFGIAEEETTRRRSRTDLVERTERLLKSLEPQAELLRFTYSLEGSGQSCQFRGKEASLECGAGYCQIVESEITPSPKHSGASVVLHRQLADLRDLEPVVLDDGREIRAKRRPGNHDLLARVRDLKRFLDSAATQWIECSAR
jgi:hypothetical protein